MVSHKPSFMAPSPRLPPSLPDFYALPMFTEKSLRNDAHLVKTLMGIAAEDFYPMLAQIEQRLPLYEQRRLQRETHQRAGSAILDCH